jgi:hypothetical protein
LEDWWEEEGRGEEGVQGGGPLNRT